MTDTSNLRNTLATRTVTAPAATDGPPSVAAVVRQAIDRQSAAFQAVLPKGIDPDRFARLVLTAVKSTPDLMRAFSTAQGEATVLLAAMQAAAIGLEPNTPTQECWLLPRRNKGVWEAQLSIGYRGLLKLARQSGQVKTIFAEAVHEKDHFVWSRGLEEDQMEHRPYDGPDDPGPLTHTYAVVRFVGGGYNFVVLNRRNVEARRAMSDSWRNEKSRPYSPWTKWEASMWRKSALRELSKYVDLSPQMATALVSDESMLRFDATTGSIDATFSALEIEGPDEDKYPEPEAPAGVDTDGVVTAGVVPEAPVVGPEPEPTDADVTLPDDPMSDAQSKAVHALLRQRFDGASGPARFPILSAALGRDVTSTKQISKSEASLLIDSWQDTPEGGDQ